MGILADAWKEAARQRGYHACEITIRIGAVLKKGPEDEEELEGILAGITEGLLDAHPDVVALRHADITIEEETDE